jgi:hypothetical protein
MAETLARQATESTAVRHVEAASEFRSVSDYLDTAMRRHGWRYDADIDRAMNHRSYAVHHWRSGRSYPTEDHMRGLAVLAGADPVVAVLNLKLWMSVESPAMQDIWTVLLHLYQTPPR